MRKTAVAVGVLFWASNLVTLVGSVVSGPIPSAHDALTSMYPHSTQWIVGTLITHVNDAAIIAYAVLLFPVLKSYGEGLALGYVAFKALEATMLVVGAATLLSLITLSQRYLATGGGDTSYFPVSADVALAQQFWAGRLGTLSYLVATPILNYLLYRSQLVPRFISVWGFIAVVLLATGLAIGVGDPTRGFQPSQLLVIPIILWELLFATWLIVRGFNPEAVHHERD
ncbi:MAG TPA: DUF4386 domain-containing protein [Candidatus Dormibacteraeota bacterium]|nr:DUF4386 domain-containing protein [Candidatus Dormibacteraeota bacterium]